MALYQSRALKAVPAFIAQFSFCFPILFLLFHLTRPSSYLHLLTWPLKSSVMLGIMCVHQLQIDITWRRCTERTAATISCLHHQIYIPVEPDLGMHHTTSNECHVASKCNLLTAHFHRSSCCALTEARLGPACYLVMETR